jgi:soluble P-type ATPase
MIKVSIIGSGSVAAPAAFISVQNRVQNRTRESLKKESLLQLLDNSQICTDIQQLKEADLYIMAVSDDAIASLSEQLTFKNKLVVHFRRREC